MKVLGVEKRDIYVAIEFSLPELRNIASFLEKAVQPFTHLYGDTQQAIIQEILELEERIDKLIEEIDNGS